MTITDAMSIHVAFKVRGSMRNLHPTTMPLWSLIQGVQSNRRLAEVTAQGREVLRSQGKDAFQSWKPQNLMAVYFACRFRSLTGRADADNVSGYTGLAGFDFDGVDTARVLAALKEVPQVVCAGVSASGKGVWCVALVSAATGQEYLAAFARGVQTFREVGLGQGLDVGAHDATRARFAAASPECWWRFDAEGDLPAFAPDGDITVLSGASKKGRGRTKQKLPADYVPSPELAFDMARQIVAEAEQVEDGDRNNAKARMAGQLKALANKTGVPAATYAPLFVETWDKVGATPKKTRNIARRLLLEKKAGNR